MNLNAAASLGNLTFNNNGGTAPTVNPTTGTLQLPNGGSITASSMNPAAISVITAGTVDIGDAAFTITTNQVTIDGTAGGTVISPYTDTLQIKAILASSSGTGSLVKAGSGVLELNGANTFPGGVTLNAGGLYITAAQGLGLTTSGAGGVFTIAGNNTSVSGTPPRSTRSCGAKMPPTSSSAITAAGP